jgi:hypothetical protein
MLCRLTILSGLLVLHSTVRAADTAATAAPEKTKLESQFSQSVHPFLDTYCISCHGKVKPKGDLDLSPFASIDSVAADPKRWQLVLDKLKAGEMPPEKAKKHPTDDSRQDVVNWIGNLRRFESLQNAGDPGPVLARRLSNAEYDYTIRDLTGVDIRPTKEFPVDPANEAGFDNSGESLTMSPSLLKKYMEAARLVSEHLVLKPDGLAFAPFPVTDETDRDKFCVNRIIAFYKGHPVDMADYFFAAWQFENCQALGQPQSTLEQLATRDHLSFSFLSTVYTTLHEPDIHPGPIAALQAIWKTAEPLPDPASIAKARENSVRMRDWVIALRKKIRPEFRNLNLRGMNPGSQPLVLWKDRQYAATRFDYAPGSALKIMPADDDSPAMHVPQDQPARDEYEASAKRFCSIFPDTFVVTERARMYLDPEKEKLLTGRLLSAGFHSQMGYFRDDAPLCKLILNPDEKKELDSLWHELDFIADVPRRTFQGMMWFERSDSSYMRSTEFDFARAEERGLLSQDNLKKLEDLFLAKAKKTTSNEVVLQAMKDYFEGINAVSRDLDRDRLAAEPLHVAALADFAQRAYRRPLAAKEREDITAFYQSLRSEDHLDHEEAVRDTLVSILMSPYFCYRVNAAPTGDGVHALSDYELASRLSYFLWSSMPDRELLDRAAAGDLHKPDVLLAQSHRMMRDPRISAFCTEFAGNWLDFRRFEEHNGVDRERFKSFDNDLREAMFQEPIRFFQNIVNTDGSVLDFLYGNYTFVNPVLARHYGIPVQKLAADQWTRVDDVRQYQRGGLLPMAVFLTKNAPGLRTSPVKRGYWVVKRLLGEEIPPPPADVPALPPDESKLGELTLPQALARHRQDKTCATCHEHFDSIGLSFEGFGPIGELRTLDLGGKPVENQVIFRDGSHGTGLEGLEKYIRDRRQDDFLDTLSRKLLAEALGRTLLLSDDPLIEQMRAKLAATDYHFGTLVDCIVTSPQFLKKRAQGALARG